MDSVSGSTCFPVFVLAEALPARQGTVSRPGVLGQPVCPDPAIRMWARTGSLRFPGAPSHTSARFPDPGRIDETSPFAVPLMLPPGPTRRRLQHAHDFGAHPRLWYPLPTLHERRCRHPCKARFRLAGCAFTGRVSNPLDRDERFQVTSVLLSRTSPDASWVHAERLVHKLDTFTDQNRAAQTRVRGLIWDFYADLKAYQLKPGKRRASALRARFDRIFLRPTGFATLDRLLARLHANKAELLMVLERPEIPLHTNGSENDIRCQVTRRKVSAGTRSDIGRDCRDAFLSLAKTCDKLGIALWDYLGSRLKIVGCAIIESLDVYVRARMRPA
jgi:Transposase IS66 family